jgi:hypothetical protein
MQRSGHVARWITAGEVGYFHYFAHYGADCDCYPRVRAAGWEVSDAVESCPDVALKVHLSI